MITRRELLIGGAAVACAGGRDERQSIMTEPRLKQAAELMEQFAVRTGLTDQESARRYLWTDAYAVFNFIALRHATGVPRWGVLASKLVERVHDVLAPHHDPEHPTAAGLRIGKKLPERAADAPYDERLEWDRDGQYFHYLTKWMHALDDLAHDTNQPKLTAWACELAQVAHRAFVYGSAGHKRMYWKMSIDLTRPLVPSMGQHDPLDGLVTCLGLAGACDLSAAIADFRAMIDPHALATSDPLGIGGLLDAARRLEALGERGLRGAVTEAAEVGLQRYARSRDLAMPAEDRLAFRELGLAIGLATDERYRSLRNQIEDFWRKPEHRANETWHEHEDINDVMLATALLS